MLIQSLANNNHKKSLDLEDKDKEHDAYHNLWYITLIEEAIIYP